MNLIKRPYEAPANEFRHAHEAETEKMAGKAGHWQAVADTKNRE